MKLLLASCVGSARMPAELTGTDNLVEEMGLVVLLVATGSFALLAEAAAAERVESLAGDDFGSAVPGVVCCCPEAAGGFDSAVAGDGSGTAAIGVIIAGAFGAVSSAGLVSGSVSGVFIRACRLTVAPEESTLW